MNENRGMLNDGKIEAILIGRPNVIKNVACKVIKLGEAEMEFPSLV